MIRKFLNKKIIEKLKDNQAEQEFEHRILNHQDMDDRIVALSLVDYSI